MNRQEFEELLIIHEGSHRIGDKHYLYEDTVNKLTLGYGRNIEDNGITEEEALYLLRNDIDSHERELRTHYPIVGTLNTVRFFVLLNMCFNLGIYRLSKFKKMWANISIGNWDGAADEMLDSLWARQVGNRAKQLADMMRTGIN